MVICINTLVFSFSCWACWLCGGWSFGLLSLWVFIFLWVVGLGLVGLVGCVVVGLVGLVGCWLLGLCGCST